MLVSTFWNRNVVPARLVKSPGGKLLIDANVSVLFAPDRTAVPKHEELGWDVKPLDFLVALDPHVADDGAVASFCALNESQQSQIVLVNPELIRGGIARLCTDNVNGRAFPVVAANDVGVDVQ